MRTVRVSYVVAAGLMMILAVPVAADDLKTKLTGYEETPVTINTRAVGTFRAKLTDHGTAIEYELSYRRISTAVTQAHIHFGRPGISGGIVLFLCTNLTPPDGVPVPPSCPEAPGTVTGTLTAADVRAAAAQGIDAGPEGFAQILAAIRAGAAYVNVHTTRYTGGEIRGALGDQDHDHHDHDHRH